MLKTRVCGVDGIEKIYPIELHSTKQWVIDVQGKNFSQVMQMQCVDKINTISDDMWEIYETLGIEATRTFLIEEVKKALCDDGSYINIVHFSLLADSCTRTGTIKPVRRNGIDRNVGPWTKAAFEEPVANFVTASIFTESDDMTSVSATIAFGKLSNIGTTSGYFEPKRKRM